MILLNIFSWENNIVFVYDLCICSKNTVVPFRSKPNLFHTKRLFNKRWGGLEEAWVALLLCLDAFAVQRKQDKVVRWYSVTKQEREKKQEIYAINFVVKQHNLTVYLE